ncbi:SNP3 protein [Uncinocarpus reesii 1704]|uniref:SNP3 protein n=1 Tax=Uncinocarpus reesii (strain UAMH 1704) TaxID=336963 RepID=C4JHG8_UNCRE|nr:SNP3 protein [Uncinocarpus reesii 1704]EEP76482.1 SNP3 protein [Uncinocarpus reesii 1704]
MAATFTSPTRPPVPRQARGDRALNTIIENGPDAADVYVGHAGHSATARRQHSYGHGYEDGSHPLRPRGELHGRRSSSTRMSSPLAPHGDGSRHSIASSNRASCSTDCRAKHRDGFDDLYDVTDESDPDSCPSLSSQADTRSNSSFTASDLSSSKSGHRKMFPRLSIPPSEYDSNIKLSHVPPTPPPKIPVSPVLLAKLPRRVPAIAAPPSLAGSASGASDRPSTFSSPQTPNLAELPDVNWDEQRLQVRDDGELANFSETSSASMSPQLDIQLESPEDWSAVVGSFPRIPTQAVPDQPSSDCESDNAPSVESNKGVQLPSAAMATLQRFETNSDRFQSSPPSETGQVGEMHELPNPMRPRSAVMPPSICSGSSFTSLSIPSPGGFFASLKGQARKTWCFPINANTPTSAVAERFYNVPWDAREDTIVEQVVECEDNDTEGPSTAKAVVSGPPTARRVPVKPPEEAKQRDAEDSGNEYDASYAEAIKSQAMSNLDRTTVWLVTQSARTKPVAYHTPSVNLPETIPTEPLEPPSKPLPARESTFYLGFKHVRRNSQSTDIFLHSNFRFEAVQASRLSMRAKHVDHIAGKYEISSPVRPPYRGPFAQAPRNSKLPEVLQEKAMFSNVEKEQDVLIQLHSSTWAIEALKFLNGGPLVPSPAAKRLAKATPLNQPTGAKRRRARVLDFGGQTACEWAWHLANEYPNAKVFTVVPRQQAVSPVDGPANHQHLSVPYLWRLPFKDNQFDLISARSLHMLLKSSRPVGAEAMANDEVDMCLKECFRCLKPGGYLEFFIMDSEIVRAGPYGSATSVEFGFNLKTRGYDPAPTKAFLSRLRKANFADIKRAWLFLPMGAPYNDDAQVPGRFSPLSPDTTELVGSTGDVASITGLFGGWMWEQWMLRLQLEMGRDRDKLLEETAAVIDEGRNFFKTLTNHTVIIELKNDIRIRGTLKSVDQYLNVKLDDIEVIDLDKYPHLSSVKNIFIRGSVVRYIVLPQEAVDRGLLEDATRRACYCAIGPVPNTDRIPLSVPCSVDGPPIFTIPGGVDYDSDPIAHDYHTCFVARIESSEGA